MKPSKIPFEAFIGFDHFGRLAAVCPVGAWLITNATEHDEPGSTVRVTVTSYNECKIERASPETSLRARIAELEASHRAEQKRADELLLQHTTICAKLLDLEAAHLATQRALCDAIDKLDNHAPDYCGMDMEQSHRLAITAARAAVTAVDNAKQQPRADAQKGQP